MRNIMSVFTAATFAALALLTGCKSVPTPEQMKSTSTAIGVAAGLVANETKIDDNTRNAVVAVMEEVARATPAQGQSFEDAWTPVAKDVIAKLVADGKIDEGQGQLALAAFSIAVKGVDYIFDIRFPKAREYEELVAAASAGFIEGFLTVFKPVDPAKKSVAAPQPDEAALKWLREQTAKK